MTTRLIVDEVDVASLELATNARRRSRGLLGRDGLEGAMWLAPAKQVHSVGMRFDLDIAFVDGQGRVLRTLRLSRNRMTPLVWRATGVVEAEAGRFDRWSLRPGSTLTLP